MVACIRHWKVARDDARPIGILVYSYKTKGVPNAVLCWSQGSMEIWWYPLARSKVEKYWAPTNASRDSWFLPSGVHSNNNLLLFSLKCVHVRCGTKKALFVD